LARVLDIGRMRRPRVVIEIGNDWLKIMEGEELPSGVVISKVSFSKLADLKGSVGSALSAILKEKNFNKRAVITSLPRHISTLRILNLPSTDRQEINDIIDLQVGKQTPYKKEEIISSYKTTGTVAEGYSEVILAIVRRNIISERVKVLQDAGVYIESVTVSSEGLYDWFGTTCMPELKLEDSEAVVLLDIDSNYSDFAIFRKDKLAFTRNILIGANQLSEEPQTWQDKLVEEIRRSTDLYQARGKNVKIVKVFLSGAGKGMRELSLAVDGRLGLPAVILDPLKNAKVKKDAQKVLAACRDYLSISSLIGLLIRHKEPMLDLTPGEIRIHKMMENKRRQLTVMGILIASIAMLATLLLLITIYNKNTYLEQLKKISKKMKSESMRVAQMRTRINLIKERLNAEGSSVNILNEIYTLTPREIYMTSINIEEKKEVTLKGRADAMSHVFKFITTLEKSDYFENVKTTYTTTKKEKDVEFAEFEIICMYQREH